MMGRSQARLCIVAALAFAFTAMASPALAQKRQQAADEPLRLTTTLVQVPAVVTDRSGSLVPDLGKSDFTLFEDSKRQEISHFASVEQPFTAVLVLDTSNSAEDRLSVIQEAALAFARTMKEGDRIAVVSFDHDVRTLCEFTSDYREIEESLTSIESGFGKLFYEAVTRALEMLRDADGRRAVILFGDGVDMRSVEAGEKDTIQLAEEIGAVVYAVRFETRWWVEAEARNTKARESQSSSPFDIDGRIPLPPDFGGPDPSPPGSPKRPKIRIEVGSPTPPPVVVYDGSQRREARLPDRPRDEITDTLDKMYGEADRFLRKVTSRTAGRYFSAATLLNTGSAFAAIAKELRHLYVLGFYPGEQRNDRKLRKLKVEVSRKGLVVRSRPAYRADSR